MSQNQTLKSGISYVRYRWVAEPGSCDVCQALNETEYDYADEVPDRPHPNCRCHVEPVKEPEKGYKEVEKLYEIRRIIDETAGDISGLQAEIRAVEAKFAELPSEIAQNQSPEQEINDISQKGQNLKNTLDNFSNKFEREEAAHGLASDEIADYEQGIKDIREEVFELQKELYDFNEKVENLRNKEKAKKVQETETNEYPVLAKEADKIALSNGTASDIKLPDGWEVENPFHDKSSNFKAVTYVKGDEVVIAFVGTDFKYYNTLKGDLGSIKDAGANLKMVLGIKSRQMERAKEYCEAATLQYKGKKITVIGHSEGGSEAIYGGVHNGLPVITYNAYGVANRILEYEKQKNIKNIRMSNDIVSKVKKPQGETQTLEYDGNYLTRKTPIGYKKNHQIETIIENLDYKERQKYNHLQVLEDMAEDGMFDYGFSEEKLEEIYIKYLFELLKQ